MIGKDLGRSYASALLTIHPKHFVPAFHAYSEFDARWSSASALNSASVLYSLHPDTVMVPAYEQNKTTLCNNVSQLWTGNTETLKYIHTHCDAQALISENTSAQNSKSPQVFIKVSRYPVELVNRLLKCWGEQSNVSTKSHCTFTVVNRAPYLKAK